MSRTAEKRASNKRTRAVPLQGLAPPDPHSPVPLHVQIRDSLAALMDQQVLPPGLRLPTVRALAASCGVALRTAAQAVEMLQREGRVASHVGRGVFVKRPVATPVTTIVHLCLHPTYLKSNVGAVFRTLQGIIQKAAELNIDLRPVASGAEFDASGAALGRQGVIFLDAYYEKDGFGEISQFALANGLPCCIANSADTPPHPGVLAHHDDAARLAAEHLLRLGHHRVALLNLNVGSPHHRAALTRQGYLAALKRYAILPDPALYAEAELPTLRTAETEAAIDRWLALPDPPTGIVCDSDERALLVMDILKARGLKAPQDVSIVGHENMPATAASDPPLTTVDARCPKRGEKAVEYVFARIAGEHPPDPEVFPELVLRQSTRALVEPPRKPGTPEPSNERILR